MTMSKVHLHSEQFDRALHAECGRLDKPSKWGDGRIVTEEEFEATPRVNRCKLCAMRYWPHGGEPNT